MSLLDTIRKSLMELTKPVEKKSDPNRSRCGSMPNKTESQPKPASTPSMSKFAELILQANLPKFVPKPRGEREKSEKESKKSPYPGQKFSPRGQITVRLFDTRTEGGKENDPDALKGNWVKLTFQNPSRHRHDTCQWDWEGMADHVTFRCVGQEVRVTVPLQREQVLELGVYGTLNPSGSTQKPVNRSAFPNHPELQKQEAEARAKKEKQKEKGGKGKDDKKGRR